MQKKIICVFLLSFIVFALVSTALATPQDTELERTYTMLPLDDKPLTKPTKPIGTSISIRNIASGDTLYNDVLIIAQATGTFDSVVYQIDNGTETTMNQVGTTDHYQFTWNTNGLLDGHILTVKAVSGGKVVASASVSITVVAAYQNEVYFEIDYIEGHMPSVQVLDYMVNYWKWHAVKVTYVIDDKVADPTPNDGYITDDDFWALENQYNDGVDNSKYGFYNYTSSEKWMLYGTWDVNTNVGGYTYVAINGKDLVAGNYIFIADAMIDAWETGNSIPYDGGEVIVTCHEAGHSIGIAVIRGASEKYDPDAYSVMSYMRLQNAKYMINSWYYSKEYWTTANLELYP